MLRQKLYAQSVRVVGTLLSLTETLIFILTKEYQNFRFAINHFITETVDHARKISWIDLLTLGLIIKSSRVGKPRLHYTLNTTCSTVKIAYLRHKIGV